MGRLLVAEQSQACFVRIRDSPGEVCKHDRIDRVLGQCTEAQYLTACPPPLGDVTCDRDNAIGLTCCIPQQCRALFSIERRAVLAHHRIFLSLPAT